MVKIRLMRRGATKRPFFRVVVADSRSPRDGRFIENIGKYHPLEDPSLIEIDADRALYWLSNGAQPTEQVENLLKKKGIWGQFEAARAEKRATMSKAAKAAKPTKPAGSSVSAAASGELDGSGSEGESAAAADQPEPAASEEAAAPKRRRRAASKKSS